MESIKNTFAIITHWYEVIIIKILENASNSLYNTHQKIKKV